VNVVDSSAWLEYFAGGPNAGYFAEAIEDRSRLLVPAIVVCEVHRRLLQLQRSESEALVAVSVLASGRVIDLDSTLAISAARLGVKHRIPLADSIVLATARLHAAIVWTQDADFEALEGVRYRPHRAG
jgi:predicted nucleic acid-binding protein